MSEGKVSAKEKAWHLAIEVYRHVGLPINTLGQNVVKEEWFGNVMPLIASEIEQAEREAREEMIKFYEPPSEWSKNLCANAYKAGAEAMRDKGVEHFNKGGQLHQCAAKDLRALPLPSPGKE